jgi:hypothetical protein
MLANLTTRALDHRLSLLAQMEGWTYTRYADDLAFFRSGKASRIAAMGLARRVAYELKVAGLIHHREKTSVVPPGARKVLLGVLVDRERPRLTRAFRNNIETHLFALTSDKVGPAAHRQKRGAYDPARFASAPCSAPSAISLQPIAGSAAKLTREIPRLCRGGSKCLTFPVVAPQAPADETSSVSRQAHDQSPIDGRPMGAMGEPKPQRRNRNMLRGIPTQVSDTKLVEAATQTKTGALGPTSRLQAAHTLGARQRPQ